MAESTLSSRLARELIHAHPAPAAAALDRLPAADAAAVLEDVAPRRAAGVLARMSPHTATELLEQIGIEAAAALLEELDQEVAARLTRRLTEKRRDAVFANLPSRTRRTLETLLVFPENTAGALMDPEVLAMAEDLTAAEALERIRAVPDQARYNLYIVDRDQILVGVINLRELMLASAERELADLMTRDPVRLDAGADRSAVVSHPGWKRVHSIPVVDERGGYLGAVRYKTLRQLEEELLGAAETDANTAEALGDVFAAGASGLLDALAGSKRRVD